MTLFVADGKYTLEINGVHSAADPVEMQRQLAEGKTWVERQVIKAVEIFHGPSTAERLRAAWVEYWQTQKDAGDVVSEEELYPYGALPGRVKEAYVAMAMKVIEQRNA
jgi:hypothetical protein